MSVDSRRDRLAQLLRPVVNRAGLDLEDVVITPAGRRRLLRVVVDSDDGVSVDDTARVSQAVSGFLDTSDVMGSGPYVLEVTSPGLDRPLTEPRHWRRAAGHLVHASTASGDVRGRVVTADEETVELDLDGQRRTFRHSELGRGKVQVEFRRDGGGPDEG